MTSAIVPVSQAPASLPPRAVAGERMMMDGGTAPMKDIIQSLYDRTEYTKDAVQGTISWSGDFSVDPGGTNAAFAVNIGAINTMAVNDGTAWKALAAAATTIGAPKIEGGGNLANSSWYYVYAWNNAGTLDYEISLTAPNGSRTTKNAVTSRRYLGCFPTDSTGAPLPLTASRGRVTYDVGGVALAKLQVVTSGTDAAYTAKSCAAFVPPHARIGRLAVTATAPGAAVSAVSGVFIQRNGSSGAAAHAIYQGSAVAEIKQDEIDVMLDSSQRFQYKVTGGASGPTADIYVFGWLE